MENYEQGRASEQSPINVGENFINTRREELQLALATTIDPKDLPKIEEVLNQVAKGESLDGGKNA